MRPRRSLLYMPGANARAMEKAKSLDCDSIIFDLEDAVSPDAKAQARQQIVAAIDSGGYGYRELIVRGNGLDTPWGRDDIITFAQQPIAAMLFPKIETRTQVVEICSLLDESGAAELPVWLMIETPRGVLDLREFVDHPRVTGLVMGTSDLVKELRATHTASRSNLDYALQYCVAVARMAGKEIFDGVHLDFRNETSFRSVCESGKAMGFDGKTLIHPTQVAICNEIFGYDAQDIETARRTLEIWDRALAEGKGVAVLDGKLVENLHAEEARRVMAFALALQQRQEQDQT